MSCGAGRTPHVACGEPSDGAAYARSCGVPEHADVIELCAFHVLWMELNVPLCTACWASDGSLVPVTITAKDTT